MLCREKTSFNPAEPKYHRLLIDLLARAQAAARVKSEEQEKRTISAGTKRKTPPETAETASEKSKSKMEEGTHKSDDDDDAKTYRKRRKTKRVKQNDVARASVFIQDTIRNYELSEVINLLGECIFYESLFIWQKVSMKRFENKRCSNSCGLVGDILLVLEGNYKALFELFMELPSMQSSKHYPVVVRSEDVSNQALQRASELVFDFLSTRDFTCIKDISPFCAKQIKVYYVPIELIMIPIEETFLSCLHIVH